MDINQPHDRINFNLRPNKRIERKLVAEALQCIYRYDSPRRFGYVGMGSYYFSDFILFHRVFGITKMVSIEYDTRNEKRFEFNKPFDCIAMSFGSTHDVLGNLEIFDADPVICWLDYYDRLTEAILGDVQTVLTRAQCGSALIITLKCGAFQKPVDIENFMKSLPHELQTPKNRQMLSSPKGLRDFMLSVLEMRIEAVLSDLNQGKDIPIVAERIFNIGYKDGVSMVTFGWLLVDSDRLKKLKCTPTAFDSPGYSGGENGYLEIATPTLTFREIAHLKSLLPNGSAGKDFEERSAPIRKEDADRFAKFYRHYPNFADIEE